MVSASVGFQCPECVKAGSRGVRSAKTPYGGAIVANPNTTTVALIVLNVAVWVGILATGGRSGSLMSAFALLPESALAPDGEVIRGVSGGAYWQVLTAAFSHLNALHLASNMFALFIFGPRLEMILGRARFLTLYLVSALASSAMVMWLSGEFGQTLGASGAVYGLLGGLLVVSLRAGAPPQQLLVFGAVYFAVSFVSPNISWQGHLGGLLGGALVAAILAYAPRQRRTLVQSAGISALVVLILAAIVVRALTLS